MVHVDLFQKTALSYPDVEEKPHFNAPSFRYKGKIFATYHAKDNRAMLKLSLAQQSVFCTYQPAIFSPVPGTWGKQGATFVELKNVGVKIFKEALAQAYLEISKK